MKYISILFALLLPIHVSANNVEDKVRKLFEVQNISKTYQEMIDQGRTQVKEDSLQVMNQMFLQLDPPKVFQDRSIQAVDRYNKALLTDRTAQQIVDVLIPFYASKFTEQELDGLIAFYDSDLGRKDVMVGKESYQYILQYYKTENERIRISATNDFVKELQEIVKECNCKKQKSVQKRK